MKLIPRAAASVGLGAAVFFGGGAVAERMVYDISEINAKVRECAATLGEKALKTTILPPECESFSTDFGYEQVTVEVAEPNQLPQTVKDEKTYTLLPQNEFLDANIISSDADARSDKMKNFIFGFSGALGTLAVFGLLTWASPSKKQAIKEPVKL